ncbi:dihydrolipoamide acetyltransferase family protein [Streptomyces sp. NPDC101225]|uniref:dihydrolipoamide acetyltransferase family protein n=1 Tax=Streptomyces sp. NPDC101225 TaxID=3366135 RepID=UPI00380012B2
MAEFTMPSLGADMDEGLLQEWLVGPGDRVNKGDVVAVVETDKAAIEVECFESGTMSRLLVEPGTRVPVGTPLAVIEGTATAAVRETSPAEAVREAVPAHGEREEAPAEATRESAPVEAAAEPAPHLAVEPGPESAPAAVGAGKPAKEPALTAAAPVTPSTPRSFAAEETVVEVGPLVRHLAVERGVDLASVHGSGRGGRITRADIERAMPISAPRVRVTPYARRLAGQLGVDLAALRGTGDGGAVRAADVHAAVRARGGPELHEIREPQRTGRRRREERVAEHPSAASREDQRTTAMRRAIGELMSRSKKEIPHYYLSTTVDLTVAVEWLRRRNRGFPPSDRLVPASLLLKAAAIAARQVPQLNGFWQDGAFVPGSGVHLGIAVSLRGGGLLAPVIHDADTLRPEDLMAALKDLVQRARRGRLRGSELSGATLTVTNLGDQGVETVYGVIHPPQVALVGFGAVVERPWATGGLLGVRPVVTVTLSADHRASDGAIGARYLTAIGRLLQNPEEL